jgi:hypothetical protein
VFKALAGSTTPVAVIPVGSTNNIAETLGLKHAEPSELAAAWPEQRLLPFDISEAVARWGQKRFVEAAGGGLVGELFGHAEEKPSDKSDDKVEHGLELLRDLLATAPAMRRELDPTAPIYPATGRRGDERRDVGPAVRLAPVADPVTVCSTSSSWQRNTAARSARTLKRGSAVIEPRCRR